MERASAASGINGHASPASHGGREIIIIAPEEILPQIEKEVRGSPVRTFTTLEELDRWRRSPQELPASIADDVARALAEAECRPLRLPSKLRSLLEGIAAKTRVPALRDLEEQWDSRRSLYRAWRAEIPSPPSTFLRRVRTLHAQRLLANGMTRKQAAMMAGYRSVDAMRRNIEDCDPGRSGQ